MSVFIARFGDISAHFCATSMQDGSISGSTRSSPNNPLAFLIIAHSLTPSIPPLLSTFCENLANLILTENSSSTPESSNQRSLPAVASHCLRQLTSTCAGQQTAWHTSGSGRRGTSPTTTPPPPKAAGESRKVVAPQQPAALFLRAVWTSQGHKH